MQLSLFSISYAGLWGQARLDVRQFISRAARLGFDAVMLAGKRPHLAPLDTDQGMIAAYRSDLQVVRLTCPAVAAYVDLGARVTAEVPLLEMQIAYVESLCRIGAQLGAQFVRVFTAYEAASQSPQSIWELTVLALGEMADRAAQYGLTLAIQNHHDLAVHTSALIELLQDIDRPNCKLGFDAWSPALRGEDLYTAAKMAAPHTVLTTNADYIRLPRYRYRPELINYEPVLPELVRAVPFGSGFIDYGAFFKGLREGGFDGVATFEMCSPIRGGGTLDNLDDYARTYLGWMRQCLGAGPAVD
jgi:sugar phosphate isomerase/epimerase